MLQLLFVAILVEQLLRTLPVTQLQGILLAVLAILMVTLLAAPRRLLTTTWFIALLSLGDSAVLIAHDAARVDHRAVDHVRVSPAHGDGIVRAVRSEDRGTQRPRGGVVRAVPLSTRPVRDRSCVPAPCSAVRIAGLCKQSSDRPSGNRAHHGNRRTDSVTGR